MAYEFKKLSDVEVVAEPTESANVLIEEDGVIKKAPKTAVGGAGGIGWDAIIEIVDDHTVVDNFTLVEGSFNSIQQKALSGEKPNILLRYKYEYGDNYWDYATVRYISVPDTVSSSIYIYWESFNNPDINIFTIMSDNTISFD